MIKYFAVDCEFSGLDHRKHSLISLGIVEVVYNDNKYNVNYNKKLYLELRPQTDNFDPESMRINGLNIGNLYKYGIGQHNACREIDKFLGLMDDDTAVFIGYCSILDKIFIDQIFQDTGRNSSPFNYEVIEISSLAMGKLNLNWGFSENDLEKLLNIEPMSSDKKHNAVEDALHQAEEFCALMNM